MSYLPPTPPLQLVRFRLELPHDPEAPQAVTVHATGESVLRRGPLWTESASWSDPDDHGIPPADWVHHIALAALQDRPNTSERLLFALTGGLGLQEPLF